MKKYLPPVIAISIAQLAGIFGSLFTYQATDSWYTTLITPPWNPPSWLFTSVWALLYSLIGIASYIVWTKRHEASAKPALIMYGVQLLLNALWSYLFFGMKNIELSFSEICLLYLLIVCTFMSFWNISRRAGLLLLPYLAWVLFAAVLNYTIWQLNY